MPGPLNKQARTLMATIDIKSEITGNVAQIVHQVGDDVEEDEPVVILESMKMNIPVVATDAGRVVEILVKVNDIVAEGATVARIEQGS